MEKIVLSICIPTYKRAAYLQKCLDAFFVQMDAQTENQVEILVSNNASPDNTDEVMQSFINKGFKIKYNRHPENIGPNANIFNLFERAEGKYVWIFPDDDFLRPGYLKPILDLLQKEEPGVLHVKGKWYYDEKEIQPAKDTVLETVIFTDPTAFCKEINFWLTFATGNIFNKSVLKQSDISNKKYADSFLPQLGWYIPAIYYQRKNLLIKTQVLYCKADNSGGFDLVKVFGINFNRILGDYVSQGLMPASVKRVVNNRLVQGFFPYYIHPSFRRSYFKLLWDLFKLYWYHPSFYYYCLVFPVLKKIKKSVFG